MQSTIFSFMNKNSYYIIGVMSGTSLDGIDLAYIHFDLNPHWSYEIITAETFAYPLEWEEQLRAAVNYDDLRLKELDQNYTTYLAGMISGFMRKHDIIEVDAVCSHGHTIKHEPHNGYTLQIGNLPQLANLLQQKVVCDFRVQDVKLGGQGAPLVPMGDEILFRSFDYCVNLGGFANISMGTPKARLAYDICAVNTVLNHFANKKGLPYDRDGALARKGKVDQDLLNKLNSLAFYEQKPPKSLGIEWVNRELLPLFETTSSIPDNLHTYAVHAAEQIALQLGSSPAKKVLMTGGGAFNSFLMDEIKKRTKVEVVIPSKEVVNFKEALIFAFLGVLRLRGEVNVLGSVTGARKDHSAGNIFLP
jgi:anhydro-N-acetylmuramic acid kinase